jgi:glutaryl-CoA dehydrogenase
MAQEIAKAQLLVVHLARRKERDPERGVSPWQVSLAKRNNVSMALDVARSARAILGAAGLSTEHPVIRHMLNLETLFTYEGTDDVHALVLGRALTGEDGF